MKKYFYLFTVVALLFIYPKAFASRSLNGEKCKATAEITMAYVPYDDESEVKSDFSDCPKTIIFDYGLSNYTGRCSAQVGTMPVTIRYGFDIYNQPADELHPNNYKTVSSYFHVTLPMKKNKRREDDKSTVVEVDPSVKSFGFPFWLTPPRYEKSPIYERLQYQFTFRSFIVDEGCKGN